MIPTCSESFLQSSRSDSETSSTGGEQAFEVLLNGKERTVEMTGTCLSSINERLVGTHKRFGDDRTGLWKCNKAFAFSGYCKFEFCDTVSATIQKVPPHPIVGPLNLMRACSRNIGFQLLFLKRFLNVVSAMLFF